MRTAASRPGAAARALPAETKRPQAPVPGLAVRASKCPRLSERCSPPEPGALGCPQGSFPWRGSEQPGPAPGTLNSGCASSQGLVTLDPLSSPLVFSGRSRPRYSSYFRALPCCLIYAQTGPERRFQTRVRVSSRGEGFKGAEVPNRAPSSEVGCSAQ